MSERSPGGRDEEKQALLVEGGCEKKDSEVGALWHVGRQTGLWPAEGSGKYRLG